MRNEDFGFDYGFDFSKLDEDNTQLYYDKVALFENGCIYTDIERLRAKEAYFDYLAA